MKRSKKKLLKLTGIITGILLVLLFAFHTWINYNARHIVEDLVESRSHGRLKMKLEKFRFSWFSRKVELTDAVIYTADSLNATTSYRFHVQHIKLSVQKIWPILFENKLLIDSLNLEQPEIVVTRLKHLAAGTETKKDVSIPEELGKIYKSIQEALQALKVNRFQIDGARFTLINKIQPDQLPLTISNIHFHIDNLSVDTNTLNGKEKLLFSDNVVLNAHNQDILFPDGRHRLSFRNFSINLKQRLVEFDSCTMLAEQKGDAPSRFRVFFDTLRLANIDFDTLYHTEVIKADSVYCNNPRFDLTVENSKRNTSIKKAPPKLEDIIQQLTGDLLLDHVIVKNADFHININIDRRPATFNFTQNSFELEGLKVAQHDARPLTVKSVALAIRNYENFIRDSTYKLKFDSIVIRENRVYLDRFEFNKLSGGKIINSFSIPRFELSGLSWDDLVFNQQLKAREATLFHPSIKYNTAQTTGATKGKKSIFATLADIGQLIQLDKMNIVSGRIDLTLKNNNAIQLVDASMTVHTKTLFLARKARAIEHAVDYLDFRSGIIRAGRTEIKMEEVMYTGNKNGFLLAKKMQVTDRDNRMNIQAENAAVDDILTDEETGDITATGISWDKADVRLILPEKKETSGKEPTIELNDLKGANTRVSINTGNTTIRSYITRVKLDGLIAAPGKALWLKNPVLSAEDFEMKNSNTLFTVHKLNAADKQLSTMTNLVYNHTNQENKMALQIPSLSIIPDINEMLNGRYTMEELVLEKPVLTSFMLDEDKKALLPAARIGRLLIRQPEVQFNLTGRHGSISIDWNGSIENDNKLDIRQLEMSHTNTPELRIRELALNLDHFRYRSPKGKHYDAGEGEIETEINNLVYHPAGDEPADWSAMVSLLNARHFIIDSIGKKYGTLQVDGASIHNIKINSDILTDPYQLVAANEQFRLERFTGNYQDKVSHFDWRNAGYSQLNHMVSLDTFSFRNSLGLDSFMARQKFRKDYIAVGCGPMLIGPVDRKMFIQDSVFQIGKINISRAWFTDYRDKRLPFAAGSIRLLPANLIRKVPFKIAADTIQVTDGSDDYTEFSDKTNAAGTVQIRRLDLTMLNVKNFRIRPSDSLSIRATGYVMDSVWVQLRLKESYTDSLGGFKMTLRAKPGNLNVLNPVLIPLVSAKLITGDVDTLNMRVVGREYLAIGEMKMFYKNLKFRILKNGKDEKQPFMTRLLNYVANNFIIRKNNSSRTGWVFALRARDRSAINYLLRIALSGMSSSTGYKSNKKMYRRYQHELEKKGLPSIDFE